MASKPKRKRVLLLDTTLREGEQTPGVSFTPAQKLAIATRLDRIGVDMIEVGHPGASPDIDRAIAQIAAAGLAAELVVHCRAEPAEVLSASSLPVQRVAIFLGTSPLHLERKLGLTPREAVGRVSEAVRLAVAAGKRVRFSAEDAFRTDPAFLVEICGTALAAGADRIGLPDTVGVATPEATFRLFHRLKRELGGAELDAHCHNDLGLAVANSLAAVRGGATCVHVTVNGLGERCGLASLAAVAVALKVLLGLDTVALQELVGLSELVASLSGIPVSPLDPVVGANAFAHKAGVHTDGVLKYPACYEVFPPEMVGARRRILLGKLAGRAAVRWHLERLGIALDEEGVRLVVRRIKERAAGEPLDDQELRRLADEARSLLAGGR